MGTDRCAYLSRLRRVDPVPKIWLALTALLLCVLADSLAVGVFTLGALSALNLSLGGQKAGDLFHFLKVPMTFLIIGCLPIILRPIGTAEALWAFRLLGRWTWGVTAENLRLGLLVLCKAMGAVSAMYFLSMNTPMTDLTMALERLHVPRLFVELTELIYRFIFLLSGEAGRIRVSRGLCRPWGPFSAQCSSVPSAGGTGCSLLWRAGATPVFSSLCRGSMPLAAGSTGSLPPLPSASC